MIEVGLKYEVEQVVTEAITAEAMGSGDMPVLATPAMIALMENAAMLAVRNSLSEGQTTVGTYMDVSHIKPTKVGETVRAEAEVKGIEGKKISFEVAAYWDDALLGKGTHTRYIVDREKFLSKL